MLPSNLNTMKKPELQQICKQMKIPHTGTKQMLIDRIKNPKPTSSTKKKTTIPSILLKIMEQSPLLQVVRNQHGRYVHPDTQFVFNTKQQVYGKEVDGKIEPLSQDDMELCLSMKLKIQI